MKTIGRMAAGLAVGLATVLFTPVGVHAQQEQKCDLTPLPPKVIDAAPTTTALPGKASGQILVRSKSVVVRIFEVEAPDADSSKWKPLSEQLVTSIRPLTEKDKYESLGFSANDSSIVRFRVPEAPGWFWPTRTFVVRVCGQGQSAENAWAMIRAPVSTPNLARAIAVIVLILLYAAFAYAIYRLHDEPHPLEVKWPAYKPSQTYSWHRYLDPVVLTAGPFNQGSIQKLQVLLFTLLVGGMLLTLVLSLGVLSDLSPTIAMLLGISAVGAAVAQKTTTSNERLQFQNWAWLVRKKALPINRTATPKWSDLVMNGREFDVYKLQTLIFTGVVAAALWFTGEDGLGSFSIPETLLGILGLSQVVYVAGALVRPPSVGDLDKALTELRQLEATLQLAVVHNVDVDKDGKLPAPLPPVASPLPDLPQRIANAPAATAAYRKKADEVEIMIESTLETEIDRRDLEPELR